VAILAPSCSALPRLHSPEHWRRALLCGQVWDASRYGGGLLSEAAAEEVLAEAALWRAHAAHVTSCEWVDAVSAGPFAPLFLLTSSADCTVVLWTQHGARVGTFGQTTWLLSVRRAEGWG
jgi:hypothetical protein